VRIASAKRSLMAAGLVVWALCRTWLPVETEAWQTFVFALRRAACYGRIRLAIPAIPRTISAAGIASCIIGVLTTAAAFGSVLGPSCGRVSTALVRTPLLALSAVCAASPPCSSCLPAEPPTRHESERRYKIELITCVLTTALGPCRQRTHAPQAIPWQRRVNRYTDVEKSGFRSLHHRHSPKSSRSRSTSVEPDPKGEEYPGAGRTRLKKRERKPMIRSAHVMCTTSAFWQQRCLQRRISLAREGGAVVY